MKKALLGSVLALTVASFGASAADMISKDEAHHFKLEYLGNVSVGASGGRNFFTFRSSSKTLKTGRREGREILRHYRCPRAWP